MVHLLSLIEIFSLSSNLHKSILFAGEGNGNPLQYPCLENLVDRGAWWAAVTGSQRVGHD